MENYCKRANQEAPTSSEQKSYVFRDVKRLAGYFMGYDTIWLVRVKKFFCSVLGIWKERCLRSELGRVGRQISKAQPLLPMWNTHIHLLLTVALFRLALRD